MSSQTSFHSVINPNSTTTTYESSAFSLNIYSLEWLTILIACLLCLSLIILLILGFYRFRSRSHHRLRQNSSLYYKSSQMTATTTSGSCESTSSEHDGSTLPVKHLHTHLLLSNNYDDLTSEQQSMGSYIYPITSTTSLLQTSPPSSIFKGEQYAVIDGNYSFNTYKQWPTNNVMFLFRGEFVSFEFSFLLDFSLCFIGYWSSRFDQLSSTIEFIQLYSSSRKSIVFAMLSSFTHHFSSEC